MKLIARILLLPIAAPVIVGEAYERHQPVARALLAWLYEGRLV